jgi:hypothetical protein
VGVTIEVAEVVVVIDQAEEAVVTEAEAEEEDVNSASFI